MRTFLVTLFLLLSCSETKVVQTDSIKQVYYRYVFMTKLGLDSLQIISELDSLFVEYNVKTEDFNLFKTQIDSNLELRYSIFEEFQARLDSNKMLDTLFLYYKNIAQNDSSAL